MIRWRWWRWGWRKLVKIWLCGLQVRNCVVPDSFHCLTHFNVSYHNFPSINAFVGADYEMTFSFWWKPILWSDLTTIVGLCTRPNYCWRRRHNHPHSLAAIWTNSLINKSLKRAADATFLFSLSQNSYCKGRKI